MLCLTFSKYYRVSTELLYASWESQGKHHLPISQMRKRRFQGAKVPLSTTGRAGTETLVPWCSPIVMCLLVPSQVNLLIKIKNISWTARFWNLFSKFNFFFLNNLEIVNHKTEILSSGKSIDSFKIVSSFLKWEIWDSWSLGSLSNVYRILCHLMGHFS